MAYQRVAIQLKAAEQYCSLCDTRWFQFESVDRILKSSRPPKLSGTSQCGTVQIILYTVLSLCIKS